MRTYPRPKLFISACIEFDACRYDGELIRDKNVARLLEFIDVIRVCPELSIGMGAPRDAVRLVKRKGEELKLLSTNKGDDYTDKMIDFTERYVNNLKKKNVDGFIMKAKSPTCGINNVKVYADIGKSHVLSGKNAGMFGSKIKEVFSDVPVETDMRLSNYSIRDRFYAEIFTLTDFRLIKENPTMKALVKFHSNNKYLFMTYNQNTLRVMGNIVANHNKLPVEEVYQNYEKELRLLLSKQPSQKKRINVLTHIYGYFKKDVEPAEKEYYFEVMDQYLNNQVPYSNVLTVLKGWAIRFKEKYLIDQTIFAPYPKELIQTTDSGKKV